MQFNEQRTVGYGIEGFPKINIYHSNLTSGLNANGPVVKNFRADWYKLNEALEIRAEHDLVYK